MRTVVGVYFRPVTKIYYFDPGPLLDLVAGDYVVVETSQGQEVGQAAWMPKAIADSEVAGDLKPVLRRAKRSTWWSAIRRSIWRLTSSISSVQRPVSTTCP